MHFIRNDSKAFISSIFKRKLSHTDKSNPDNIALPESVINLKDSYLDRTIKKILKKYKQKNYTLFSREALSGQNNWCDMHIMILVSFYKQKITIVTDKDDMYFPNFLSTFNPKPLQKEIDKVISKIYDKIDPEATKEQLKNRYSYTALDISYLLYYLTTSDPNSKNCK